MFFRKREKIVDVTGQGVQKFKPTRWFYLGFGALLMGLGWVYLPRVDREYTVKQILEATEQKEREEKLRKNMDK